MTEAQIAELAKMDTKALLAAIIAEREANAKLRADLADAAKPRAISFKVSEKAKALSVYGLQRNPVTLYAGQWERIAEEMPRLLAFIKANPTLARK